MAETTSEEGQLTDLRAEVSREIALNLALSASSGDINYDGGEDSDGNNENNSAIPAVAAAAGAAAARPPPAHRAVSEGGAATTDHRRRRSEEEEDLKAKERAKSTRAVSESHLLDQRHRRHQQQEEEDLTVGVGVGIPVPPIPAPVRVGAYCHTPGSKTSERRLPIQYDSLRGHLTASSTDISTSATSVTSSCTSNSSSRSSRTSGCGGFGSSTLSLPESDDQGIRSDDRVDLERRKTLLNSLHDLSNQCLQEEQAEEEEEEEEEEHEEKDGVDNQEEQKAEEEEEEEVSADQLPTPGVPTAASMPTSTVIPQQQQQRAKTNVETTTLPAQHDAEIRKDQKQTTNTEVHHENTSKTLEEAEDDDFCLDGCLDPSGSSVDDNIPIAAKLAFNETESEMFNRIKDIVLQEESQRCNSVTTVDQSTPIHVAEAIILPAEQGAGSENNNSSRGDSVVQQEQKLALKRRRKRNRILLVVAVVLCILVLVGALIGLAVGRQTNASTTTTTTATDTSSPLQEEEEAEEHTEENLPSSSSTQPPQSIHPPPQQQPEAATNAMPSNYLSQCVLLNYPQVVAFNQTQKEADTIISAKGPVPETICEERVPLMQKSIYCQEKQTQGSGVTNLVAQSQVWWYQRHLLLEEETGVNDDNTTILSLVNAGFIKADICQGDYTMEMANTLLPYDSRMVVLPQVLGASLVAILEEALEVLWVGFQNGLNSGGGYPYLGGGLRFDVNMTAPFPHRLSNIQVRQPKQQGQNPQKQNKSHLRGRRRTLTEDSNTDAIHAVDDDDDDDDDWIPIDLTANYTLITNSYLVDGGDGYSLLSDAYGEDAGGGQDLGVKVRDAFVEYSQEHLLQNPPLAEYSTQTYIHDPIMF